MEKKDNICWDTGKIIFEGEYLNGRRKVRECYHQGKLEGDYFGFLDL